MHQTAIINNVFIGYARANCFMSCPKDDVPQMSYLAQVVVPVTQPMAGCRLHSDHPHISGFPLTGCACRLVLTTQFIIKQRFTAFVISLFCCMQTLGFPLWGLVRGSPATSATTPVPGPLPVMTGQSGWAVMGTVSIMKVQLPGFNDTVNLMTATCTKCHDGNNPGGN